MDVDLDDTHLCIKCNATIIGIDEYVQHRRRNCIVKADQLTGQLVPAQHHSYATFDYTDDDPNAKPEESFSFASTNAKPINAGNSTSGAHSIATSIVLHDPSRVDTYECELGADIFFSSLELQSSSKPVIKSLASATCLRPTAHRGRTRKTTGASSCLANEAEDWIDDVHTADGSAQLMKAVRDISGCRKTDSVYEMLRLSQDSPISFDDDDEDEEDDPMDDDHQSDCEQVPPPSYTKGKWVPGTKIVRLDYKSVIPVGRSDSDKFRCRVCDRSLANELAYAKHLKSELHIKRSMPEQELELASQPGPSIECLKRTPEQTIEAKTQINQSGEKKTTRFRRHIYIKCDICQSRLARHLYGKHLISQFHYRRMSKLDRPYDHLFEHLSLIVHQSPFQCQPCRFYANTESQFLRHWNTQAHRDTANASSDGPFWCSFCKFKSANTNDMEHHLIGSDHQSLLQALDRSVPVVIRKMSQIVCINCNASFQLNIQLRQHALICSVQIDEPSAMVTGSASDEYQSKFRCEICSLVLRSRKAYQMHSFAEHRLKICFCSICSLTFKSAKLARQHRMSTEHKVESARKQQKENLSRKCRVCKVVLGDVLRLREHLRREHPDERHSCTKCGALFDLQQELSRHVRDKLCFKETMSRNAANRHKYGCNICDFRTSLKADLIYHQVMHNYPADNKDSSAKLPCPLCRKPFRKPSLRQHLRQHTDERQYTCKQCAISFGRRANLKAHNALKHFERGTTISDTHADRHLLRPQFHCHRSQVTTTTSTAVLTNTTTAPMTTALMTSTTPTTAVDATTIISTAADADAMHDASGTSSSTKSFATSANDAGDCCLLAASNCDDNDDDRDDVVGQSTSHQGATDIGGGGHSSDEHRRNGVGEFVCDDVGCNYRGKTKKALTRHTKMHAPADTSGQLAHRCDQCPFQSRFAGHLKRHRLVHTGEKPFACPHCEYSCNNSENLRKHVLSTKLHPGRCLYECGQCAADQRFTTNYFKEFNEHVVRTHQ